MYSIIILLLLLQNTVCYPYYIIFNTKPGIEYDVFVNKTFISVINEHHTALLTDLPIGCIQRDVKKQKGLITLYYECNESASV